MKHGVWTKISYYWRKQREFKSMEKLQEEEKWRKASTPYAKVKKMQDVWLGYNCAERRTGNDYAICVYNHEKLVQWKIINCTTKSYLMLRTTGEQNTLKYEGKNMQIRIMQC